MAVMREEWFIRDGLDCVPCCIFGYCDPKGRGWCRGNRLVSPDLAPAAYFRLDQLRDNAALRLHVSHLNTHQNEGWRDAVASCSCHNLEITREIKDACRAYTTQFPEEGTGRFEEACHARPAQKAAKKLRDKTRRQKQYQKAKVRAGGTRLRKKSKPAASSGKPKGLTEKDWAQRQRPVLNTSIPT